MKGNFKARAGFVYFLFLCVAVIISGRLFFVQIINGEYYDGLAKKQYNASGRNFNRGSIYFSDKDGSLMSAAAVKEDYQLVVYPKRITDAGKAYSGLSAVFEIGQKDFMAQASAEDAGRKVMAKKLSEEQADEINRLKITGVAAEPDTYRYYPAENLASHALGFVGYDGDKLVGRYGLEARYDDLLNRDGGGNGFANSFTQIFSDVKRLIAGNLGNGDIVTTMEPMAQSALEKSLEKAIKKHKGEIAGGIILDPKTGEIIAMAAKPDFDPNNYSKVKDFSVFMNPNVESVFEMGSIMKPLTIAAAIDSGSITASTTYEDKGFVDFKNARIKNYDGKARGFVNMQKVLDDSLNTGAVFAMQKTGKEKFLRYLLDFGLSEKTGVDLPREVSGKLSNLINGKNDIEYATASFGQGIAVTPLEITVALSSLANGGVIMKPYIVKEEIVNGLKNRENAPTESRQPIKKETAEEITKMLVNVVDKALLQGQYKLDRYSVAAKTGTAQIASSGGGYLEEEYLHTFFGYAPAYNPKFLAFIYILKPQGVKYAAHSLTEPFMDITKFLLNYYEVPPDR
ncbi:MAG: penicillin-binding protein 2 [Candidatus Pacebacteria bacterium]|nr:penicillin-binding protein 2 [Candidatus Paceibacterota bacterium]NUQ57402.1 penicillin-binding protein 2 [Candidatus Paceibacter sp.]